MKPQVTLYLPGLLCDYMKQSTLSLPSLFKLLSRAQKQQNNQNSKNSLHSLFTGMENGPIPSGALSALGQQLIKEDNTELWCIASLVECLVTHQTAYIVGNESLQLSEDEAKSLLKELNQLLNQDGITLIYTPSLHWLCRIEKETSIAMTDLWEVLHKHLFSLLPKGSDSPYWQRLITECQMLLENASVNKTRCQSHLPVASSLWFWGIGKLPLTIATPFDIIYTDDEIMRGLGKLAQCQVKPSLRELSEHLFEKDKHILIADMRFYHFFKEQLLNKWEECLQVFETTCFDFLLKALSKGKIEKLHIITQDAHYHISKMNLHFFWKRIRNPMLSEN